MILLSAVAVGTLVGWGIARRSGRTWHPPAFHSLWLVFLGFLPQYIAFYLPPTRRLVPDELASLLLVISQILLMAFAWKNLQMPGMQILMFGLGCNLVAILANGGFMPLAVETVARFVDQNAMDDLSIGGRMGKASKDILLPESQILFPWLADRFVSPQFFSHRVVFSFGDVLVAAGAFWMLVKVQSTVPASDSGDSL